MVPGYPSFVIVAECFTSKNMNLVQFRSLREVHFLDYNPGPLEPPMITTNITLILSLIHSHKCKSSSVNFHSFLTLLGVTVYFAIIIIIIIYTV